MAELTTLFPSGASSRGAIRSSRFRGIRAALQANAERLGRVVASFAADAWSRTGRRGDSEVTAIEVLCEAVHETRHHLKELRARLSSALVEQLEDQR